MSCPKIWCIELGKVTELDREYFDKNILGKSKYFDENGKVVPKQEVELEIGCRFCTYI